MLWWCSEGHSQCLPLGIEDKPRPGHSAVILLFLEEGGGRRSGGLFHDYDDDDDDDDAEDADMEKKNIFTCSRLKQKKGPEKSTQVTT